MNHCFGTQWTAERCLAELVQREEFAPQGCLFVTVDGIPQGAAAAWLKREHLGDTGFVHMVGVIPEFRGRGFGRLVTLAVLHWLREQGYRRVILHTDDWRLPAIRTYLRLGFQPVLFDDHHTRRWEAVWGKLGSEFRGE
jgi:mycothiol synthase